jgi:hypothetical protein
MNLQSIYFEIIQVEDNPYLTEDILAHTCSLVLQRRKCIQHYSLQLKDFRPVLFEHLINIYYHPEVTLLLQLIIGMPHPRKYYLTLRHILAHNIQKQFPYGDTHVKLMANFIHSVASKSLPFHDF